MFESHQRIWTLGLAVVITSAVPALHAEDWPVVFRDDFSGGVERWQLLDPQQWRVATHPQRGQVLSQFQKTGAYKPPHRSPFNIALAKEGKVGDFTLDALVLSTHPDYGHRDAVLVFGYQDPAHFYYVHLGKKTDDHANQIFIVHDAPRVKISTETTPGTNWDDRWHHVRIVRRVNTGEISVFYDDLNQPIMRAVDQRLRWGRIGVGTFDDTADFDDIELRGILAKPSS